MSNILEFASEEDREEFINEFRHQADMIKDLQEKLALTEKALELACDELRDLNYRTFDNTNIDFEQQFKKQAEKELKGE